MAGKSYRDLKEKVWNTGICSGCGACVAVCPADAICFDRDGGGDRPVNIGYCKQADDEVPCGACYSACPRTGERMQVGLGPYESIISARSAFEIPRKQSGGAVTAILVNALEQGLIDAVVTVSEDRWTLRPSSVVITSTEELVHQAGSRYNWWVPLVKALKTAVIEKKCRKIALIGVPCVVHALKKIRESDNDLLAPFGDSIRLVIGLFCTESFDYHLLMEGKLKKEHDIETWDVDHLDVKGKLEISLKNGSSLILPLRDLDDCVRPGCRYCNDLTGVHSDISAGAVGSPPGHTTLIIRNHVGEMFVESAKQNGRLNTGTDIDIEAIKRLSALKESRCRDI
jgi:coenzyme F420 hydrogenase subunit beta